MNRAARAASSRAVLLVVGFVVAASGVGSPQTSASAQPAANPYPPAKSTHWAWQNRPDLPPDLGEGKDWAKNAETLGWPVTSYPRPYSVAVYNPGVLGADPVSGHVAIVKQVNNDGSYTASQTDEVDCAGGNPNCGRVNTRLTPAAPGVLFIHYMTDTRTTWGFAGGASGWTPAGMGPGNVDGSGWRYDLAGGDPRLVSPALDVPLDSYDTVEVDMAFEPGTTGASVQIYFATQGQSRFTAGGRGHGITDGATHTYAIRLSGSSAWTGRLGALRLDPGEPGATGSVRIDRIRLVHFGPPARSGGHGTHFAAIH